MMDSVAVVDTAFARTQQLHVDLIGLTHDINIIFQTLPLMGREDYILLL